MNKFIVALYKIETNKNKIYLLSLDNLLLLLVFYLNLEINLVTTCSLLLYSIVNFFKPFSLPLLYFLQIFALTFLILLNLCL